MSIKKSEVIREYTEFFRTNGLNKFMNFKSHILEKGPFINDTHTSEYYPKKKKNFFCYDPIPLVIENKDWLHIKAGVDQRARMFKILLNDIESI